MILFVAGFLLQTAVGVNDLIGIYQKIAAAGVPLAIVLALWANYKGWWLWNREVTDIKTRCKEFEDENKQLKVRMALLDEEKFEWKAAAIYGTQAIQKRPGKPSELGMES